MLPCQPAFIVAKIDCATRILYEVSDQAIIQQNAQGRMEAFAAHQKLLSISQPSPFERGAIWNSKSRAERTAKRVSIFAAGFR